jgi:hypothetical protein
VRRCRDHAENGNSGIDWTGVNVEDLQEWLAILDSLAASREAEQGVEGKSGWRYRVEGEGVLARQGRTRWILATPPGADWRNCIPPIDHPTVAALIERHGGNDAN